MRLRIVLVEPKEWGNVGAVARAMKNFDAEELFIVGNREANVDPSAVWWSSGADDLLKRATRVDTLQEALRDVHLSVATTAARSRHVHEQLTPSSLATLARETLGDDHTLALVFGREEWGLTSAEIAQCQRTASIPTSSRFPTMNLAQSVVVFCYELRKDRRAAEAERDPAPGELIQHLDRNTQELLDRINYFGHKDPERIYAELRTIATHRPLSMRQASLLLDLVRAIRRFIDTK